MIFVIEGVRFDCTEEPDPNLGLSDWILQLQRQRKLPIPKFDDVGNTYSFELKDESLTRKSAKEVISDDEEVEILISRNFSGLEGVDFQQFPISKKDKTKVEEVKIQVTFKIPEIFEKEILVDPTFKGEYIFEKIKKAFEAKIGKNNLEALTPPLSLVNQRTGINCFSQPLLTSEVQKGDTLILNDYKSELSNRGLIEIKIDFPKKDTPFCLFAEDSLTGADLLKIVFGLDEFSKYSNGEIDPGKTWIISSEKNGTPINFLSLKKANFQTGDTLYAKANELEYNPDRIVVQ